jgi:hypothetical protein
VHFEGEVDWDQCGLADVTSPSEHGGCEGLHWDGYIDIVLLVLGCGVDSCRCRVSWSNCPT